MSITIVRHRGGRIGASLVETDHVADVVEQGGDDKLVAAPSGQRRGLQLVLHHGDVLTEVRHASCRHERALDGLPRFVCPRRQLHGRPRWRTAIVDAKASRSA